jgi:hypothetical protein
MAKSKKSSSSGSSVQGYKKQSDKAENENFKTLQKVK